MNRKTIIMAMTATGAVMAARCTQAAPPTAGEKSSERPNILIIVGDDCSFYELGCYGAKNNVTPNIDALARDGMLFNRAYNSASMSTPTRHCLYTGMYPVHNGGYANHSGVRQDVISMPVHMDRLGYRTGLAGKWHIRPNEVFPFERVPGFRENCLHTDPSYTLDGVREFMSRDRKQPFCLVLASINPHLPWTGGDPSIYDQSKLILPPQFIDTPQTREIYARYLAEVTLLDNEVGDMVKILKENGLYDNTLIVFISEQGTEIAGAKWNNYNVGVRAGMIVRWAGHLAAGSTTDALVQYEDILPTFMDVAGGAATREMDGRSIVDVIEGKTDKHRDYAFSLTSMIPEGPLYPIRSVTDGEYKLIHNFNHTAPYAVRHIENKPWFESWREKAETDERSAQLWNRYKHRPEWELYNVSQDPWEMKNLHGDVKYAGKTAQLREALEKWMERQGDKGMETDDLPTM